MCSKRRDDLALERGHIRPRPILAVPAPRQIGPLLLLPAVGDIAFAQHRGYRPDCIRGNAPPAQDTVWQWGRTRPRTSPAVADARAILLTSPVRLPRR